VKIESGEIGRKVVTQIGTENSEDTVCTLIYTVPLLYSLHSTQILTLPSQTTRKVVGLLTSQRSCTKERAVTSCDRPQKGHFVT
jgi:hypothetical protein